ncbi:MAG: FecR domain-containing protein [Pirellulales bacterium]|nr:FecR domain-containing protein [Pirellulales bacterium]
MSNSLPSEKDARVRALTQAVYHEQADEAEMAELRALIEGSREAAWIYAQYMHLFAGLHWDKMHECAAAQSIQEPASSGGSAVLGFLGECFQQGVSFLSKSSVFSLLVAIGLPGLVLVVLAFGLFWQTPREARVAWQTSHAATIARTLDSSGTLGDSSTPLAVGSALAAGETISLARGVVEVAFADGARVILEGQTTLDVLGRNAGRLRMGRLSATVPPSAHGFAIDTPTAKVVDLGTNFGVRVASDQVAEAHVFGGKIEVSPAVPAGAPATPLRQLVAGEAARIHAAVDQTPRVEAISASSDEFVLRLPPEIPRPRGPPIDRLIASVVRRDGRGNNRAPIGPFDGRTPPLPSDAWGLRPGAMFYSDRLYVVRNIDEPLVGADYVRTFNSDKYDPSHRYDVTFPTNRGEVFAMVLLDDRAAKAAAERQAFVDRIALAFARPGSFFDTGYRVLVDDTPDGADHLFCAFGMTVPTTNAAGKPITYAFGGVPRSPNRYSHYVIAVLPQPPPARK